VVVVVVVVVEAIGITNAFFPGRVLQRTILLRLILKQIAECIFFWNIFVA